MQGVCVLGPACFLNDALPGNQNRPGHVHHKGVKGSVPIVDKILCHAASLRLNFGNGKQICGLLMLNLNLCSSVSICG